MSSEIVSRKYIRTQVSKYFNAKDTFGSKSGADRGLIKAKLTSYLDELKVLNSKIQASIWQASSDETEFNKELDVCDQYNDRVKTCLVLIDQIETGLRESLGDSSSGPKSLLKKPTIPLPSFTSSEEENIEKFFIEFETTLDPYSFPDREKFLLLKQQVSGRASVLLQSLDVANQKYASAKDLLVKALASRSLQKHKAIQQLSRMKLDQGTDPFAYMSQITNVTALIDSLKIKTEDFLQYFIWLGLNETFKSVLVHMTNHVRPSLTEIKDHFFEASERYLELVKKVKSHNKTSTGLAANIVLPEREASEKVTPSSVQNKCFLCDQDHMVYKCPTYETPQAKSERLKQINGCGKCASSKHSTDRCKFRFNRRCVKCKGWHFSYLCAAQVMSKTEGPSTEKKPDPKKESFKCDKRTDQKKPVSAEMSISTKALHANNSCSILPTFQCSLMDGTSLRGLKDSGSQTSFITERAMQKHNFRVMIDEVALTIHGFNSSKEIKSKLVEIICKFGPELHTVEALCVPSIEVSLDLPGLSGIAQEFHQRGYQLADPFILDGTDKISKFDIVLGTNAAYILMDHMVRFGSSPTSAYVNSTVGVMLLGNIGAIKKNLCYLEHAKPSQVAHQAPENIFLCSVQGPSDLLDSGPGLSSGRVEVHSNLIILDQQGEVVESKLRKASEEAINKLYVESYVSNEVNDSIMSENNQTMVRYALDNASRDRDGRLIMPLLWNYTCSHLLGTNFRLAKAVLMSNLKKNVKNAEKLNMMDACFKEQESLGIIERIHNLDQFVEENPTCSFLAHMPVFKMQRERTKCRIVFLSNICEPSNSTLTVNHNQAMFSGPSLNYKISSAMMHLRFGSQLVVFDIHKAFNQIALYESDQKKLLFLWFRNVERGDFDTVGFKCTRLPFGLKCSPTILMISLFKLLVLDNDSNTDLVLKEVKELVYQLLYMDNGAYACDDPKKLKWAYTKVREIFRSYKMELQQFYTNNLELQAEIDIDAKTNDSVNLLGLEWNRVSDTINAKKILLDEKATTKRQILSSIASNYDVFSFHGPMINRARLFMHSLQCNKSLGWDDQIPGDLVKEWHIISKQANSFPAVPLKRSVGERNDDYRIQAYVDASKSFFGVVVYIFNLRTTEKHLLCAKNKLLSSEMQAKSIPSLELLAVELGVETLMDVKEELCGSSCLQPITITGLELFSDSFVALTWLQSYSQKFDKLQKRSVFVMNRLSKIVKLCDKNPIRFTFINGIDNPGDCITRCLSLKVLLKTNYFTGAGNFDSSDSLLSFSVPHPLLEESSSYVSKTVVEVENNSQMCHLIPPARFSSLKKLISVHAKVLECFSKWKAVVGGSKLDHSAYYEEAWKNIVVRDQNLEFPDICKYFSEECRAKLSIPNLVSQLNLFPDAEGILRVKCKFDQRRCVPNLPYPILLSRGSELTKLIVLDNHERLRHVGCFQLVSELRQHYWIPKCFATVKAILSECIICKRFNRRQIKLNQSPYRDFRLNPSERPFGYVYMDYCGPFNVKQGVESTKVWLLCITCMFTRAINIKVCINMSVAEFLRAFALHCFDYGLPQYCVSDLGTQLVAASGIITDFLSDPVTVQYFEENNVKNVEFMQYFKGCSQLGSMVEIMVKLTKQMIYKSIKLNVLDLREFEYLVCHAIHLINRRPIAFKDALRSENPDTALIAPITPEELIHGFPLISVNVIPGLQSDPDPEDLSCDFDPVHKVRNIYEKLKKTRANLINVYHTEFLNKLMVQATDVKGRYAPVTHDKLSVGDVVLVKDLHCKPVNYPLGVVKEIMTNLDGEVTSAKVLKGATGEITKRHVSNLIPLLKSNSDPVRLENPPIPLDLSRPTRKAAVTSRAKTQAMLDSSLV